MWSFVRRYLFALGGCVYLFTAGVLRARHRGLLGAICRHFGYVPSRVRPALPVISPDALPGVGEAVDLRELEAGDGSITLLELTAICRLVRARKPSRLFEFGTFEGRTTINLACNAPEGAAVFTLDLPPEQEDATALAIDRHDRAHIRKPKSGARMEGHPEKKKGVQLFGDSATFDYAAFENSIDFVFIDGSHSLPYVVSDTRTAMKLLRSGRGILVWHDYSEWPGVTEALNQLYREDAAFRNLKWVRGTTLAVLEL